MIIARQPVTMQPVVSRVAAHTWGEERGAAAMRAVQGVEVEAITYLSDGLQVKGFLLKPPGPGPFPSLIFCRGGSGESGALTNAYLYLYLARYAAWGYAVAASQYRGNGGSEGRDEWGDGDISDVLNLIPILDEWPAADASRIGIYGWSRGSINALLALARTARIRAAVVAGTIADIPAHYAAIAMLDAPYSRLWRGGREPSPAEQAALSPINYVDHFPTDVPILIMHGAADCQIPAEQSLILAAALQRRQHPYRLVIFEGDDHGLHHHLPEAEAQVEAWLGRFIRDGERL
jgi:dipeptidyl aminopeptidase/acylaminoacyl peptidase